MELFKGDVSGGEAETGFPRMVKRKSNTILGKPVPASPPDTSPLNSSMVILAGQNVEKFNNNGYQ